jgi:hypothetical protein
MDYFLRTIKLEFADSHSDQKVLNRLSRLIKKCRLSNNLHDKVMNMITFYEYVIANISIISKYSFIYNLRQKCIDHHHQIFNEMSICNLHGDDIIFGRLMTLYSNIQTVQILISNELD